MRTEKPCGDNSESKKVSSKTSTALQHRATSGPQAQHRATPKGVATTRAKAKERQIRNGVRSNTSERRSTIAINKASSTPTPRGNPNLPYKRAMNKRKVSATEDPKNETSTIMKESTRILKLNTSNQDTCEFKEWYYPPSQIKARQ